MERKLIDRFKGIVSAIDHLNQRCEGLEIGDFFSKMRQDPDFFDLVCRGYEIIGEAIKKIPDEFYKKHPNIEWLQYIDQRNLIAHEYFDVDAETLWYTYFSGDFEELKEILLAEITKIELTSSTEP